MTIVYASDRNYAALTAISAVSALRHNPGARIVLLGYNLEDDAKQLVASRVGKAGVFEYRDVSAPVGRLKDEGYSGYTSYAAYARIFIADVLNEDGRVVYLDGDTLVNGPLQELLSMDMHGCAVALGGDCIPSAYKKYIRIPQELPYRNSGVMLVDLARWRQRKCRERILEELAHPHGPNPLGDQDVIVRCLAGEAATLAPKWNFMSQYFLVSYDGLRRIVGEEPGFSRADYSHARGNAAVYHFSGHTLGRPWYTSSRHPMREAYLEAARAADLPEFAEQVRPMLPEYRLQYWLHRLLPQTVFDIVCNGLYRLNIWRTYHV